MSRSNNSRKGSRYGTYEAPAKEYKVRGNRMVRREVKQTLHVDGRSMDLDYENRLPGTKKSDIFDRWDLS